MIIDIHDVWRSAEKEHSQYVKSAARSELRKLRRSKEHLVDAELETRRNIRIFFRRHLADILDVGMRDFSRMIADYDTLFPIRSEGRARAKVVINRIFDYDKFSRGRDGWNAYDLCMKSPYKVCPYCHINQIDTHVDDATNQRYRPQLDHFIDKATYPFLSLCLGNLVPSCGTCNGPMMKHDTNVLELPHLSPLKDKCAITFKLRSKEPNQWSPLFKALREPSHKYEIVVDVETGNDAAINSVKTFQLKKRYQMYLHDAYNVAKIDKNPAWLRVIESLLARVPSVEDRLGFSVAPGSTDFKNIPQGKMRLDVYQDSRGW